MHLQNARSLTAHGDLVTRNSGLASPPIQAGSRNAEHQNGLPVTSHREQSVLHYAKRKRQGGKGPPMDTLELSWSTHGPGTRVSSISHFPGACGMTLIDTTAALASKDRKLDFHLFSTCRDRHVGFFRPAFTFSMALKPARTPCLLLSTRH